MNGDPASLANLHDIVVPDPLPLWPPAPGWLWLLGILALLLAAAGLRVLMHWQRNRYRREALAELEQLQAMATGPQATGPPLTEGALQQQALARLSVLLKRTALTAYPRAEVAGLTGSEWFGFLDARGNTRFSDSLGEALESATYCTSGPPWDGGQLASLFGEARHWIRHHVPATATTNEETAGELREP